MADGNDPEVRAARLNHAWEALFAHFGADQFDSMTSSRRRFGAHLLPDLQSAVTQRIDRFTPTLIGVHQFHETVPLSISALLVRSGNMVVATTPVQFQDIDIGELQPFSAINSGLWLFRVNGQPIAILLSQYTEMPFGRFAQVEIGFLPDQGSQAFAQAFLEGVQQQASHSSLYKGKVLSFDSGIDRYSGMRADLRVHKLPTISRESVILDPETLARLDLHVFDFDRHRGALKELGQSTRKGILLYGPPGNGKTHIVRHIASNLADRTTILITAEQVVLLSRCMLLARTLQPSIVVLEDVDLVGRAREDMNSPNTEVLLNRLLNEMDGLNDDADILFVLTTNRPEDIEDALASRPGRVDEAIEIANPNADSRRRLVRLYGSQLTFEDGAIDCLVEGSEGASAAFVKEIVRRMAQAAISNGNGNHVKTADVSSILDRAINEGRVGQRIKGYAGANVRAGRKAPPFDECGSDLPIEPS